ncbi:MAG: S8 family serine peptidase [Clostridiales bacterium]|nr:S8 family serine peptidase [Clostridiales bacterium]
MKKIITTLLIAAMTTAIAAIPYRLAAENPAEMLTIIVEADDISALTQICGSCELIYEYDLLLDRFAVRVPSYALTAVGSRYSYNIAGEYSPMSTEISSEIVSSAIENHEYKGEGMCIALLDTGFLLEHESFILTSGPKLTREAVDILTPSLSAAIPDDSEQASLYISEKIPFAYNYASHNTDLSNIADHGTAMLYAAAGNSFNDPEHSSGAAPEAQILAMKVYSDLTGRANESAIIAAMEDAVKLGADAICLSLGEMCGFSNRASSGISLETAIKNAESHGVIVTTSAGNVGKIGTLSAYYNEYAIMAPTTDNTDTGTIAYPGSSNLAFTAGSCDTNLLLSECITLSDDNRIPYSDSNYMYSLPSNGLSFQEYFKNQSLEYVIVDGLGTVEDFSKVGDITGKIAVVERGEINFSDKAKNAAKHGAVGMIIIDNQSDTDSSLSVRMDLTDSPIPAILISTANGELLKNASDKHIIIDPTAKYTTILRDTPTPSEFSADGVTPELGLKPDISVIGSAIESITPDGGYTSVSGTSVSAARLAGMLVCVKQRLLVEKPELTSLDAANYARQLLVSSAQIMTQALSTTPYSPRQQGGGAASLENALNAELLLSSDGKCKIECGKIDGRWLSFNVTVENLSDEDKICSLDAFIGSDGYNKFTFGDLYSADQSSPIPLHEQLNKQLDDEISFISSYRLFDSAKTYLGDIPYNYNAASDGSAYGFTLRAGSKVTFNIGIMLDNETYQDYCKVFKNGFFIEGFIRICSKDETASIPFLAYSGNWYLADAIDADVYTGETPIYDGSYLYRYYNVDPEFDFVGLSKVILGTNPYDSPQAAILDRDMLYISPTVDPENAAIWINLGLLRNISDVSVSVIDPNGELVEYKSCGDLSRTYLDYSTAMLISPQLMLWNGRAANNPNYIYPDGIYTVILSYHVANSPNTRLIKYPIIIDSEKPQLITHDIKISENDALLELMAIDNFEIADISVYDSNYDYTYMREDELFDISMLRGEYIYIEITDFALNSCVTRIDNPLYMPSEALIP